MRRIAVGGVAVAVAIGLAPAAQADVPTYKTRCPAVRVGTKTVTVDIGFGSASCRTAGAVLKTYVRTKPKVGANKLVTVAGIRWSCTRNADRSGAAWRYICSAMGSTVLGGRLLKNSVYRHEKAGPAAAAKVVEDQGIAGVQLGDSMAKVQQTIGRAEDARSCGRGCTTWGYTSGFQGVVNFGRDRRVASMFSHDERQRTAKGIGVGSSEAAIRKAYPSARCRRGPYGGRSRICTVRGRFLGRAAETAFPIFTPSEGVKEIDVYFAPGSGA